MRGYDLRELRIERARLQKKLGGRKGWRDKKTKRRLKEVERLIAGTHRVLLQHLLDEAKARKEKRVPFSDVPVGGGFIRDDGMEWQRRHDTGERYNALIAYTDAGTLDTVPDDEMVILCEESEQDA